MNVRIRKFRLTVKAFLLIALALSLALATFDAQAATTNYVVTPASTDWAFVNDNGTVGDWATGFENGPATPPLGAGSAYIQLNSAGAGIVLGTQKYLGVRLADITAFSYSTYTNLSPAAMSFQINYDPDVTTIEAATWYGRLVYEPYVNGTVTNSTWQTWDMINGGAGKWWASNNPASPVDTTCPQAAPCTWTALIAAYPNIGIRNDGLSGIMFKAGSNWNGFDGNVDDFTFETGGNTDVYDFELPATIYVDDDWSAIPVGNDPDGAGPATKFGTDSFATVQNGVNAVAAGGTVNVYAGAYTEQVTITKDVHLLGAGAGVSFIYAPATLPASGNATSSIVLVSGSGVDAEISGFTIAGPGPSGCGSIRTGIYVYDAANANIHDNAIIDIRDNPLSGCQNGVAIFVGRQAWATTGTATIANNVITGYQKGGIVVDNAGSSATITNNVITGIDTTTVIAQNGIQISRGATATLTGNTVSGNSFHLVGSPWDWGSAGILLYQSGNVTLAGGNTVSGNDQNLYISSATGVTIGAETLGPSTAPIDYGYDVVNLTTIDLDLTNVTFPGAADNFDVEDRIWHGIDDPALGLATWVAGNLYVTPLSGTIQGAVDAATANDTINVAAGTYDEDVNIYKTLTLTGENAATTIVRGVIGGADIATFRIAANNVTLEGFTITRLGNNTTDWNNAGLNSVGVAIQGAFTGAMIQDNIITANRTGIDINNSSGHTVQNNAITNNRTGMIFRNQTDNMTVVDNEITNNWTMGILFLDASGGTNSPVQSALASTFRSNNLTGNWYGQVVERQSGGSLPLPGTTNLKNFVGNWWGTMTPVVSTANSAEPGYSSQIPVEFGGTAVAPGGQPDILGPASANIIYNPVCFDLACTNPVHNITQGLDYITIQSAIDAATAGDEIHVDAGVYVEDLVIDKALTLLGPNAAINPNTGSRVSEAILRPAVSAPDPNVCEIMTYVSASGVVIKGFTYDGDNPALTSGLTIGSADVDACELIASYDGVGSITVENNILKNSSYTGIDFYNYYNSGGATSGNYIRYNRFENIGSPTYGYGIGVLIYNNFYAAITDNVMTGVRVGIQTGNFSQANPGATNSIANNQISSWRLGLFHNLWYGPASPLTISNNAFTAENYAGAVNYSGILLSSMGTTVSATVSGNTVTVPGTDTHSGYTAGYNVWNVQNTAPITISGGTVTGGDYGVFVNNWEGYSSDADNTYVTVNGVTIHGSDIAGVYVKDSDSNTNGATVYADVQNSVIDTNATGILVYGPQATAKANFNNLSGNPTAGITNSNTTFTMDGTYNWWGSATGPGPVGPGAGVNVSTFVDYDPWCFNSTCTPSVHNITQSLDYFTIQAAIDAASNGDVIQVDAGTYVENVVVTKPITIGGAGAGTIVMPAVSNPVCGGGSLCGGAASNVFLVQASNVIIHDLTVEGDNPALTSGVVRGGADLNARNGIIKNTNATYNNLEVYNVTMQNIYLRGIYSTGGSFNFHDNTVTNVQGEYASIAIFAWGGPGTIASNTVSYANDAIAANHSNGIQFLNNTVTNSSSGIHTDNSGDGGGVADLIQGNTVTCTGVSGAYGIFVFVPYLAPTVNNNTVTNCDVGLSVWGGGAAVTIQFTNNTVTGNMAVGGVGVYLTTSMAGYGYSDVYANFSGNTVTGYESGVYLDANQQSWEPLPYVAKTVNATFDVNRIYGNTSGADKNTTGTYVTNFEHNWWGSITGPSGAGSGTGNPIGAGFDFTRWCGNAACTFFEPSEPGMPVGVLATWDKTYNWNGVIGATHYILELQTATGAPVDSTWVSASSYCSGITCSVTPAWNVPNGNYRWRISDYNAGYGYGAYSDWQYFTLNLSVVTLGAPSGTLTSWDKFFYWTGYSGPTHYLIEVQTSAGAYVESTWVLASSACSGTACQKNPGWDLPNGDYRWRIRTYGATGYGPYTAWQNFTLNMGVVVLGAPSGTLTSWDKTFNWTGFSGPTHYLIEVQTSAGAYVDSTWVLASSACSGTVCQKNPGWTLPNGDYRWRIRTYGATGYGPYTAWQNFTLNMGVVVLGAPSGTLTSWDHSFSWTGFSGPTHYLIEVQTSAGVYVDSTWALASSVCSGTNCLAYPGWLLPNGDYRWRIRPYSTVTGYGSYTAWQYFTLNLP